MKEYSYKQISDRLDELIFEDGLSVNDAYGVVKSEFGNEYYCSFVQEIRTSFNNASVGLNYWGS